jgi:hypothetical protein
VHFCNSLSPISGCIVLAEMASSISGGDYMTILQAGVAASRPRALVAILSAAKQNALVACFIANGLHKTEGAWHGVPDSKSISGVTVADLARDGMLTMDRRLGSAQLTERGTWFAQTLVGDTMAATASQQ